MRDVLCATWDQAACYAPLTEEEKLYTRWAPTEEEKLLAERERRKERVKAELKAAEMKRVL